MYVQPDRQFRVEVGGEWGVPCPRLKNFTQMDFKIKLFVAILCTEYRYIVTTATLW